MKTIGNTLPRRFKAKASGSITAGKPCVVEADGDVAQVAQTSVSQGVGSAVVFTSSQAIFQANSATFDSNSNKIVFTYSDYGNSGYGTAVVGTASGTSISFGTPVVFESAQTGGELAATFDTTNNKVLIAYRDSGNSGYGTAIVGTVSGDSISFGSAAVFESASTYNPACAFDSNAGSALIAYRDSGNSNQGTAIVATISGTSVSFGSAAVFETGGTRYCRATFDSTNNKVVIAFMDDDNVDRGKAVVATISSTSVSFGTVATFETTAITENLAITFDSSAGKVVIAYEYGSTSNCIVGTVSSTDITFGSPAVFNSNESRELSCTFDSGANKVVVVYRDEGNSAYGTAVPMTVSGTSISKGTATVFESDTVAYMAVTFDSNSNVVPIMFYDQGNSNYGTGVIFQNASTPTNLTSENYIGIAEYAAADTETATVLIKGGVSTTQSSLTPGQTYFVQADGTIGTSAGTPSVTAGTAVTSTKLIVKG
jgi:hypothetical protein